MTSLIKKYNVSGPRYTSYPTVPYWNQNTFSRNNYLESLRHSFRESNTSEGISLYIHLPFCESLCTFCACHKYITKRHEVEETYINSLLKEWKLYCKYLEEKPKIREIHLGGGTPTFFSPENLKRLIYGILEKADLHDDYEFSFEGHPNNTNFCHLKTLSTLGFTRVSFGVQDYSPKVQKAINRIQSYEQVRKVTQQARELGFTSISHDLVFGLPHQTKKEIQDTIFKTKQLLPDRISFYSYAHVPWIKGVGQRGFDENDLPLDEEKRELYELGKELLIEEAYEEVGMDHFSLETDTLFNSFKKGNLHRNFMGYTSHKTQVMIGLGLSAISDSWYGFAQNEKNLKDYQQRVNRKELPIFRGHILSKGDLQIRRIILDLMCQFKTPKSLLNKSISVDNQLLEELFSDNLIDWKEEEFRITEKGKPFVRNVCMAFDHYLIHSKKRQKVFSSTI